MSFWKRRRWRDSNFFRCKEKMEITGRDVRALGWVIKQLPAELLQEMCWPSRRVWPYTGTAHNEFRLDSETLHRPHFKVGGCCLHFQPLQRCYCQNSGSPTTSCVMQRHYSITYTQSLHAIIGLISVRRKENLLCGRSSYKMTWIGSILSKMWLARTSHLLRVTGTELCWFLELPC